MGSPLRPVVEEIIKLCKTLKNYKLPGSGNMLGDHFDLEENNYLTPQIIIPNTYKYNKIPAEWRLPYLNTIQKSRQKQVRLSAEKEYQLIEAKEQESFRTGKFIIYQTFSLIYFDALDQEIHLYCF